MCYASNCFARCASTSVEPLVRASTCNTQYTYHKEMCSLDHVWLVLALHEHTVSNTVVKWTVNCFAHKLIEDNPCKIFLKLV